MLILALAAILAVVTACAVLLDRQNSRHAQQVDGLLDRIQAPEAVTERVVYQSLPDSVAESAPFDSDEWYARNETS
jgi:hypothetical protein